jgi:hypothetical protein
MASRTKRRSVRKAKRTPSGASSTARRGTAELLPERHALRGPAADEGAYRGDGVTRGEYRTREHVITANNIHINGGLLSSSQVHVDLREHALCWGHGTRWDTMLHDQQRHAPRCLAADEGAYRGDGVPRGKYRMRERVAVANAH